MSPRTLPAAAVRSVGPVSTDAILESISDGVFTVDAQWRISSFNRAAEEITGIPRAEALGRRCSEVFRASTCENSCALRRTLSTGKPVVNTPAFIVDREGRRVPIALSTAILRDASGQVVGGAETFRDLSLLETLREQASEQRSPGGLVGRSPAMRNLLDLLPTVAQGDTTVLIQGETGTGKELVARALHSLGPRRDGPFVAVNCSALPDTLLESELFGYRAGAFTGAVRDKPGRFALAEGGTLFLDEIGDVSPALQVRLLRVLQERTYEPLGATRPRSTNVRIVVATHRDLPAMVQVGTFRLDLYYRVNVMRLELPPLRSRREDIPLLVDHLLARLNLQQGRAVAGVTPEVLAALTAHDYPGNVRELQNALEHAMVLCREGLIGLAHLPPGFGLPKGVAPAGAGLAGAVQASEARALQEALARHHGNRQAAARELGVHKSTFFRKARSLGVALPAEDGRSRRRREDGQ